MSKVENMGIYDKVRQVPAEACKGFNNGSFSGTDINPMWRIKVLTEQFGPCGLGWYTEVVEHWSEEINGEITTNVAINLYVKFNGEWSKPIYGIGGSRSLQQFKSGPKVSDEGYKMAYTDAISVAAKALGVGADIYYEKDKTKYTAAEPETKAPVAKPTPAPAEAGISAEMVKRVNECKSLDELMQLYNMQLDDMKNNPKFKAICGAKKLSLNRQA